MGNLLAWIGVWGGEARLPCLHRRQVIVTDQGLPASRHRDTDHYHGPAPYLITQSPGEDTGSER